MTSMDLTALFNQVDHLERDAAEELTRLIRGHGWTREYFDPFAKLSGKWPVADFIHHCELRDDRGHAYMKADIVRVLWVESLWVERATDTLHIIRDTGVVEHSPRGHDEYEGVRCCGLKLFKVRLPLGRWDPGPYAEGAR